MIRFKTTSIYRVGISVALLLVLPLLVAGVVRAQSTPPPSQVLTITPTVSKPNINPGASVTGKFQVINDGAEGFPISIYAAPYSVSGESYDPDFVKIRGKSDASKWLQFGTLPARIEAGKSVTVNYTITVPPGTAPGGYYAVAFAASEKPKNAQGVSVNVRVGELFYIRVNGPVKQQGQVLSWEVSSLQQPPLRSSIRLENSGGVHYTSDIKVVVRDVFGRPKHTIISQKEVLPQTIRLVPLTWDKAPAFGLFKVTGTVSIAGKDQGLTTRYVLVMSRTARIVAVAVVVLLLVMIGLQYAYSRRKRAKHAGSDTR